MKPKTLILMVVAVTCGLGASYMTSRLLAQRSQGLPETESVQVLVAAKNLEMGVALKNVEEAFVVKNYPKGEEPKDAIAKREDLKDRVLKRALRAGDFVRPDDLFDQNTPGLWVTLPAGHRAVGIRVNMEAIAGGFASLPHSRVDIIATIRRGSDKDSFSQVLLENVLVLAADTQMARDDQGRAMPANVVTVALKPEDVLKVNMAKELGPLSLVLRKFNDNTKTDIGKVTVEQILTGTSGQKDVEPANPTLVELPPLRETPKVPAVAQADPEGKVHRLRIIEGDRERSTEYLVNDAFEVIRPRVDRSEPAPPRPAPPVADPAPKTEQETAPPRGNF